jgi:hypothetical protein
MNPKQIATAALLVGNTQGLDLDQAKIVLNNMMYIFTKKDHINEINTCYHDVEKDAVELGAALADLKSGEITKIMDGLT